MNPELNINLTGIPEERWTENRERCADCRRWLSEIEEEEDGLRSGVAEDGDHVPLLLWRKDGQEMLTLCWPCAEKRMSASEVQSGSE